jgi:hypothetical protein
MLMRCFVKSAAPYAKAWPLTLNAADTDEACDKFRRHYGNRVVEPVDAVELTDENFRELMYAMRQRAQSEGLPVV